MPFPNVENAMKTRKTCSKQWEVSNSRWSVVKHDETRISFETRNPRSVFGVDAVKGPCAVFIFFCFCVVLVIVFVNRFGGVGEEGP